MPSPESLPKPGTSLLILRSIMDALDGWVEDKRTPPDDRLVISISGEKNHRVTSMLRLSVAEAQKVADDLMYLIDDYGSLMVEALRTDRERLADELRLSRVDLDLLWTDYARMLEAHPDLLRIVAECDVHFRMIFRDHPAMETEQRIQVLQALIDRDTVTLDSLMPSWRS